MGKNKVWTILPINRVFTKPKESCVVPWTRLKYNRKGKVYKVPVTIGPRGRMIVSNCFTERRWREKRHKSRVHLWLWKMEWSFMQGQIHLTVQSKEELEGCWKPFPPSDYRCASSCSLVSSKCTFENHWFKGRVARTRESTKSSIMMHPCF